MLNLCGNNHDEICFEGRRCPFCEALEEKAKLEAEIENYRRIVESLEKGSG